MRYGIFAFLLVFACITSAYAQDMESRQKAPVVYKSLNDAIRANTKKHHSETAPYMKGPKIPHNNQWDNDEWRPEHWVEAKGSAQAVIDGFYDEGVIVRQYEDKVPVLEVGKPFLRLSPPDQRRLVEFIDYAFEITQSQEHGVFYIVIDGKKGQKLLGLYSKHGLQLQ